jgi:hypothetical protein
MKAIVIVEENSTRDSAHVGYNLILGRPTFSTLAGRSVSSVQKNMTAAVEMFKWGKSQGSSASACGGFRSFIVIGLAILKPWIRGEHSEVNKPSPKFFNYH